MQPGDEKDEVMVCGMICKECDFYHVECTGCMAVKGIPFWVAFVGIDQCPVYECCIEEKKFDNCGQCEEFPCDRFTRYQDLSVSGENEARTLKRMVARLKELYQHAE